MKKSVFCALVCSQVLFAEQNAGYQVIENKAELPLLNSELAQRKTLKLQLPNGLQALLISDPGTDKSAAALAVQVGSWNDPKEYEGMAHFCEHMLFMGTKAYPKEFEYMHYVTDHAGSVNAYTSLDRTVYMFSINHNGFQEALDRFAHFFIDPLFSSSCINRELLAVDQEHAKNVENDSWRQYMIFKETCNSDHPHSGFSTGSAATLSNIPQSALKSWYEKNYSANKMHLVVLSPLSIDELTNLVVNDFSAVPAHQLPAANLPSKISSSEQEGHITFIKPIRDLRKLSLQWELPKQFASIQGKKYAELLGYVLEGEGDKSLLSLLKKEKIAEGMAIEIDTIGKEALFFTIGIDLTASGVEQIEKTILLTFEMLAKIKQDGIPSYLFDEMKQLATLHYQYQTRQDAFSFITKYAHAMVDENLATFPEATFIPTTYSESTLKEFASNFKPQNMVATVVADPKLTGVLPDKKEKWMNAEYAIRSLSPSFAAACTEAKQQPFLDLPQKNPYIPTSLELINNGKENQLPQPTLLVENAGEKIYYSSDEYYKTPESCFLFSLKSPLLDGSAKSMVLGALYLTSLKEKLSSSLYLAQNAGIHGNISQTDFEMQFMVDGYSQTAPKLAQEIFSNLSQVEPSREDFAIYQQMLSSTYQNYEKELPLYQALETLSNTLTNTAPTCKEKAKALEAISYSDFIDFSKKFSSQLYIEGTIYGNLSKEDAANFWQSVKKFLACTPYPVQEHKRKEVLVLSERQGPYMITQNTERQGNSVVLSIQEGAFSFQKGLVSRCSVKLSKKVFLILSAQNNKQVILLKRGTQKQRSSFSKTSLSSPAPTNPMTSSPVLSYS